MKFLLPLSLSPLSLSLSSSHLFPSLPLSLPLPLTSHLSLSSSLSLSLSPLSLSISILSLSLPDIWQAKLSFVLLPVQGPDLPPAAGRCRTSPSRRQRCPPPHPHNRQEFNPAAFPSHLLLSLSQIVCVSVFDGCLRHTHTSHLVGRLMTLSRKTRESLRKSYEEITYFRKRGQEKFTKMLV
jgi:hypothetical protein